jgi:acetyltransferase-like isoleucine patch superfamily enzyme
MVAAGSVVLADVAPRTIVRGNPAEVVKQLG